MSPGVSTIEVIMNYVLCTMYNVHTLAVSQESGKQGVSESPQLEAFKALSQVHVSPPVAVRPCMLQVIFQTVPVICLPDGPVNVFCICLLTNKYQKYK